ncbi:MAG: protein kinase [Thermoguttaceae bacterium]|nr:protein kinase [Thermoguttaceae bacterium]
MCEDRSLVYNGYTLIGEWSNSQQGEKALAEKDGKKFFLKKYRTVVKPGNNGALDAKTIANNEKLFDEFRQTRERINNYLREVSIAGGNIVAPREEFMIGNQFAEACELIEGAVPDDELETALKGIKDKRLLMLTAASALATVHRKKIVHSDLKLKNVLLAKSDAGEYVAKLIDFDSSYFVDNKPDDISGDKAYYSPELGAYTLVDEEDEEKRREMIERITEKSDIFSLGLIFHYYLCGSLPETVDLPDKLLQRKNRGKIVHSWEALCFGGKLQLSPDVASGEYASLIDKMLEKDPNDRPSASETLTSLKSVHGGSVKPVTPRPADSLLDLMRRGRWGKKKLSDTAKPSDPETSPVSTTSSTSSKSFVHAKTSATETSAAPSSPVPESGRFDEPWPEDLLEFDLDAMKAKYQGCMRATMGDAKGYILRKTNGKATTFRNSEALISLKLAKKIK